MATASSKPTTTVLSLPPEIREHIYFFLLQSANNRIDPPQDEDHEYDYEDPPSGPHYKFDLSIFRVNRLFYTEAKPVFQRINHFVKISTPFPGAINHVNNEGRVAVVCTGQAAIDFTNFHLRVMIATPHYDPSSVENALGDEHSMVTCIEDVEAFTTTWYYSHLSSYRELNDHLTLRLDLKNPHGDTPLPPPLQSKLLSSFSQVKDLNGFSLSFHGEPFFPTGAIVPTIAERLEKEIVIPPPSPQACLEECMEHRDRGLVHFTKATPEGYAAALQEYVKAFKSIQIIVDGRERRVHCDGYYIGDITSGPFSGQSAQYTRLKFRINLVTDTMAAYNALHQYEEAWFWGHRSINLFMSNAYNMVDEPAKPEKPNRGLDGGRLVGIDWDDLVSEATRSGFMAYKEVATLLLRTSQAKAGIICSEGYDGGSYASEVWSGAQTVAKVETRDGPKWSIDIEQVEGLMFAAYQFSGGATGVYGEIQDFEQDYRKRTDLLLWPVRYLSDNMG